MVTLRPFKALRPDEKYVDRVAALPYNEYPRGQDNGPGQPI